jgi:integrase
MATPIYIIKRKLKGQRRNGQATYRYALRWRDPVTRKQIGEATGTADLTQARELQKLKWAEVNGIIAARPETIIEPPKASWADCRAALKRAMEADNLRPSYIADALLMFDAVQKTIPNATSPADVSFAMANEYKRQRAEQGISAWTLRGDLSTLKAVFGKWLIDECGLLADNPFAKVKPPKCDDIDVRIVSANETATLAAWLCDRWNNWRPPIIFLEVAALVGWRATEIASIREEDLLADGHIRVVAGSSKTRKYKYSWLPSQTYDDLKSCCAGGFAFGRFADELRRLLLLWKRQPHHAAKIKGFTPDRLVGWLQDELQRFNDHQAVEAAAAVPPQTWQPFTLHDFRRTAISGMQMAGVTEKEASVMVGATPEVMRRHYEKLDQLAIAKRSIQRRLGNDGAGTLRLTNSKSVVTLLSLEDSKQVV